MIRLFLASVVAILPLGVQAQGASPGFCENYVQTFSLGDNCPDCRVTFLETPGRFVQSNTGWSAELTQLSEDETSASGTGRWGNVGNEFAGEIFDIELARDGELLQLVMVHRTSALTGRIESTYICAD